MAEKHGGQSSNIDFTQQCLSKNVTLFFQTSNNLGVEMVMNEKEETQTFKVLVNIEEQYSFWPSFKKEIPFGWKETGIEGTKEVCAAYVDEVWTDMRPLSLRRQMEEAKNS